jgi:hypothetical protein
VTGYGPKPGGPTHPAPSHPKPAPSSPGAPPKPPSPSSLADDRIFLAVAKLRLDLARPHKPRPPSKPPRKPINTKPIRGFLPPIPTVPFFDNGRSS